MLQRPLTFPAFLSSLSSFPSLLQLAWCPYNILTLSSKLIDPHHDSITCAAASRDINLISRGYQCLRAFIERRAIMFDATNKHNREWYFTIETPIICQKLRPNLNATSSSHPQAFNKPTACLLDQVHADTAPGLVCVLLDANLS